MGGIKLLGYGYAHGDQVVTNQDLSQVMDTSDQWIRSKTGIGQRYFAGNKTNADIAAEAGRMALQTAGLLPKDIDLLLVCTFTPDVATPSVACRVAGELGLSEDTLSMDLNGACSGFVYGMTVAEAMLARKDFRHALVIGSEKISPLLDMGDRGTSVLFGDGAGALVVRGEERKPFAAQWGCISNLEVLYANRFGKGIHMRGQEVYRFAVETIPASIESLLEKSQVAKGQVDWYVCHQANLRILRSIAGKLGEDMEKFYVNIQRYGNTSAASVAICLGEMMEKGILQDGDRVVASGFGAGLTYGSMLLTI